MKKGLIIAGLLSSCLGSNGTPDSPPPLIVEGKFDVSTNSNLGLLTRGTGLNTLGGATSVRIDLPLPELGGEKDRDRFVLGLECDAQQARICGGPDLRCYSCTAYGESSSGLPEDFFEYDEEVVRASRCTALIVAQDPYISGIVTDPRGYKYQIRTLLPPASRTDGETPPGYGYEGIRVQDWNVTVDYRLPEKDIAIPINLVEGDRALLAKELRAPKITSRSRRLPETDSSQRRTQAKADDDGSTITLLYYLTKRAMCQWTNQPYATCVNDPAALVTMAGVCTAYGNLALANSNVDYVYENVHIHVDEKHDEGTSATSGERLRWIGASRTAAILRDKYGADLVVDVFYKAGNGAAGTGWVPEFFPARSLGFSSQGGTFTLISYIIAHEIGHNMGLLHNREEHKGGSSEKSNYGYNDCDQCFMTIMSYDNNCRANGCLSVAIIPYFSNTDVKYTDTGGRYAMGDAANDSSATLNLSRFGVAMHRFKAPQLILEVPRESYFGFTGPEYLVFSVVAKESVEVNNVEFVIGGAMEVGLYTATGPFEGKESDDAFWGDAHVVEDITPMSDANPLLTSGFAAFENFPTLSLSKGSTTSFKIKHESDFYMKKNAVDGAKGDIFFENKHLQVALGSFGNTQGFVYSNPAGLYGAFRYKVAKGNERQRKKCISNQQKAKNVQLRKISASYKKKIKACAGIPRKGQRQRCAAAQKKKRSNQIKAANAKLKKGVKTCNDKFG
eukprot:CAMPEP_0194298580 /NCGR_PEP_ID=MMETSP0169-20130528/60248_1 /TAXON_ID=218684 /ORGANISM="Corethron pennatum, Strain L29A3" /LENGTH=730 /DNA_ID=CAMNT_0039048585 /DNA_START=123 /DNA_END=2315 /DNA_ORIENTATION=-